MLEKFKNDLLCLSSTEIFRKYMLIPPAILDANATLQLKTSVADHFEVNYESIHFVGSSQLGFSIKPNKRFMSFGEESDIDIAIVSPMLFERVWMEAYRYKNSHEYWPEKNRFFEYLSLGWIRPDKFPPSTMFEFSHAWWAYFSQLTSSREFGPYKIRAGLYHSMFF